MESSYNLGEYNETILNTVFNTTPGSFPWSAFPYEDEFRNGTDIFLNENVTIRKGNLDYGTSNTTASAVIQSFTEIFPAYTTQLRNSSANIFRFKTSKTGPAFTQDLTFNPWLAPNNVTRHLERLATALTNVVRSAPSRKDVAGHAYGRETFISVRWEWMIFPLLLLLLSLAFLVSTIVKTSKDVGAGNWKTSAMPALIYSLPKEAQGQFTSSSTWSNSKSTKKVRIRLSSNLGWRVSGQETLTNSPRLPPPATTTTTTTVPRGWI